MALNTMELSIVTNTQNGNVLISVSGKQYQLQQFKNHPTFNNLYFFESTSKILEKTYCLSSVFSKKIKYANIFDDDFQNRIVKFMNN